MQTVRAWMVSADGSQVSELPVAATPDGPRAVLRGHDGRLYLVGQASHSGASNAGIIAAVLGIIGGVLLVSFAAEALPGAMIAHYGYHLSWGKSAGIGVASAVGWNMITGLLRGSSIRSEAGAPAPATLSPIRAPSATPAAWFGPAPAATPWLGSPAATPWFGSFTAAR